MWTPESDIPDQILFPTPCNIFFLNRDGVHALNQPCASCICICFICFGCEGSLLLLEDFV